MTDRFEIYNKCPDMIRQLKPVCIVHWIKSTSPRGRIAEFPDAAEEMVARLVHLMNNPPQEAPQGRYVATGTATFIDTAELDEDGDPVVYTVPDISGFPVSRLVGMLNITG